METKKNTTNRNSLVKLYNPKIEGLGSYDINYINAYRKKKSLKQNSSQKTNSKEAA
tara:strand:+ start:503 stop:670 length:168 start_codon:yes stop_codon:yes gene_type:complete